MTSSTSGVAPKSGGTKLPGYISPLFWLITVVLITINLRPFLAAPGPLGHAIQATTGMDLRSFSWLTLLPMVMMGVGTWLAPTALRHWGARWAVCGSLVLIAIGCALRMMGGVTWILIATAALCGAGVALVQGILPGLIKRQSPHNVAPMMGLYSAALMGGGALGAQLSPMAVQWGMSWQASLAMWAIPVLISLPLAWRALSLLAQASKQSAAAPAETKAPAPSPASSDTSWLVHRHRTWLLVLSFGLMNGGYASTVAWLAPFYQSHGWSATQSGTLVAILSIAQAVAALTVPALAARSTDRRPWVVLTLALQSIGFLVLALWPDAAPTINALVLGAGLGACFSLYMVVALDHLPSPSQAGALNALMQGGGFILAAIAPWIIAQLHESSGSWVTGWLYQAAVAALVALLVTRFNPKHYVRVMRAPQA